VPVTYQRLQPPCQERMPKSPSGLTAAQAAANNVAAVHTCRRALLQTPPPKAPQAPQPKVQEAAAKTTTKTATAPVKTGTAPPQAPPKKAQETGQGRTATTGTKQQQPAGTTGEGARQGLGKFDFLAPDTPGVKSATAGRRYAWGAGGSGLVSIEQRPAGAWQV
jgi:hypothetical protein